MHQTKRDKIIIFPSHQQIKAAAYWLQKYHPANPDLEYALNLVILGKIVPDKTGELVAISYKPSINQKVTPDNIQGAMMINSQNTQTSFESSNQITTKILFSLVKKCGLPKKIITSSQVKQWIRPLMLEHYQIEREYDQLVMICTQLSEIKDNSKGRWATLQDKPALIAYEQAYITERGSGNPNRDWNSLIKKRQIAVLEYSGKIASVVRYNPTANYALVVAPFTFPEFRRQGLARQLLAFLAKELLSEYAVLKLWVDKENIPAIALYCSLNFQQIGSCYTGYFSK
ncbi:putative acyltransferase [Rivularia sp. PCC 7116]|uniref:GNAT family N-acetyltransferase n=1 Tax=Rivularia sp. PCC 7116 TaxID=373994 RepID=UPI00029F44B3|nr:GNAT family N-acetyltransferase [Rivularia sp. PCC 7116]AFY55351.1 putative acyltransferase [Rivularia sp. PCC 7116]